MTYVCMPMHMYWTCDSIAITDPPPKKKLYKYFCFYAQNLCRIVKNCNPFNVKINRHFVFTIIFKFTDQQIYFTLNSVL